jgi:hypothetical protein
MADSKMLMLEVLVERAIGFRFQHTKDIAGCFCIHKKHPDVVAIILEVIAPEPGNMNTRTGKVVILCGPQLSIKKTCCISELTPYKPLASKRPPRGCVQVVLPVTDSSGSSESFSSSSSSSADDDDTSDTDSFATRPQDAASALVAIEPLLSMDNYTSQ